MRLFVQCVLRTPTRRWLRTVWDTATVHLTREQARAEIAKGNQVEVRSSYHTVQLVKVAHPKVRVPSEWASGVPYTAIRFDDRQPPQPTVWP
jgi:hypothetical protein